MKAIERVRAVSHPFRTPPRSAALNEKPNARRAKSQKKVSNSKREIIPFPDRLPIPSKDYALDIEAGRRCARELIADMAAGKCADSETTMGVMVFVMIEHRYHIKAKGVMVGFMAELSRRISLRVTDPIVWD